MEFELAVDGAQLVIRQAEVGEPGEEIGGEHALLAVEAVAGEPDQLTLREA